MTINYNAVVMGKHLDPASFVFNDATQLISVAPLDPNDDTVSGVTDQTAKTDVWKAQARKNIYACIDADLNLYVSTTGSDTNNGLTAGTAWQTPHKALNWLSQFKIMDNATVTINVGAGDWNFTDPIKLFHPDGMRIKMVGAAMLGNRTAGADATGSGDKLQSTGSSAAQRAADRTFNKAKIAARWATRFYFTNGSGGLFAKGGHLGYCDKIAFISDGSAATNVADGHNACGASNHDGEANGNTTIKFSPDSAIVGFGTSNCYNSFGGSIYAGGATITGAGFTNCLNNYGGTIHAASATITGAGNTNCYNSFGGSINAGSATITGAGNANCYNFFGGSIYAESATITGAGSVNCYNHFGGSIHAASATITGAGFYNCLNSYGGSIYAESATIDNASGTGLKAKGSGSVIYYNGSATCSPALNTVGNGGAYIGAI